MKLIQYLSICLCFALLFSCTVPDEAVKSSDVALAHKQQILDALNRHPVLIDVVVRNGWETDAKDILVAKLNAGGCLPGGWLSALAGLEDPETYPALIGYFVNENNRAETYRIIRNLPGIKLDAAVLEVWSKVKQTSDSRACRDMIPIGMEYGILESLEFANEALSDDMATYDPHKSALRFAIHLHVGEFATDADFRTWLITNRGTIRFDPETKRFVGDKVSVENSSEWRGRELPGSNFPNSGVSAKENLGKLSEITLPENPERAEMVTYIRRIKMESSNQSAFSPSDPQVGMLMAVGSDNLDLLIEEAQRSDDYLLWTINLLARPEHKELILKNLPGFPELIQSVLKFGWEGDAREVLVGELSRRTELPPQWVSAVAGFEDLGTYSALISYFERGSNKVETYEAIRNLKGIDLTEAVPNVWKQVRYSSNSWEVRRMIPIAIDYGVVDSLFFASTALQSDPWIYTYDQTAIRDAVHRYVGVFDSDRDFNKWLELNKGTIRFDKETQTFVGKYSPEHPVNPNAQRVGVRNVSLAVTDMEDALKLISLPDEPSSEDVKAYIKQVRDACGKKRTAETEPLRTAKLVALGPENSALLIQESEWIDGYSIPAIKQLVRPEDKAVLFENLDRVPSLMDVVLDQGWEGDIKDSILVKISNGYCPISWVRAAIRFDEPNAYAAAVEHFVVTSKRYDVYQEIKNAPGISKETLDSAVQRAWKKSKQGRFSVDWWDMVRVALECGIDEALEFADRALLDDPTIDKRWKRLVRDAVHRHVGPFETDEAFREWLNANKGAIQFDSETKKFIGARFPAPQSASGD